jgi:hypothetical protein
LSDPYVPSVREKITAELSSGQSGRVGYEGWMNAWFMKSLVKGELTDLLGDYREFLNLVLTIFNKVMDIFLHVTTVDSIEILHKFTCIELKSDRATKQDLRQVLRYEDWLSRKLAAGDNEMIQSILVARRFADSVIAYVKNYLRIEEKTVRLITYNVAYDNQDIELQEECFIP